MLGLWQPAGRHVTVENGRRGASSMRGHRSMCAAAEEGGPPRGDHFCTLPARSPWLSTPTACHHLPPLLVTVKSISLLLKEIKMKPFRGSYCMGGARHTVSIVQDAEGDPAPAPKTPAGAGPRAGGVAGWGHTSTGPACSGGVGVPGRQAAAGVGALQVDALGGRGAVVVQSVGALVPICRRERRDGSR